MNVALLSREFPPFRGGGIGTYTEQAAIALVSAGHRVVVVTVSHDGSSSRSAHGADPRVEVVRVPLVIGDDWSRPAPAIDTPETRAMLEQMGPWSVLSRSVAGLLPALIRERSIDVVEAPECGAILWWTLNERRNGSGAFARDDGEEPLFVVQLHSPNEWIDEQNRQAPPRRSSIELREAERWSARLADLVISPSRDLAAWVSTRWGIRGVQPVPYPLGSMDIRVDAEREFAGPLRALLVGRLEPRKGVDVLLRALAIATRRGADVRAELAGEDTRDWRTGAWFAHRAVRTMLSPEIASRVTLLGKLDGAGLAGARRRANVCVAPGAFDNFPYAVVESMASGLPVIAPGFGGVAELVRHGVDGFLFEPHDPASLAEALRWFAARSANERAAMGANAGARVREFCSNHRAVEIRERVFADAIRAKHPQPSDTAEARPIPCVCVGGESPRLHAIVESGRAPFAIGWQPEADGTLRVRGTPTAMLVALAPSVRGPIAVRRDLLDRCKVSREGDAPDAAELLSWLVEQGLEGAVECSACAAIGAVSCDPDGSLTPLALEPGVFASTAPVRMAGRLHPYPWPVVPVGG